MADAGHYYSFIKNEQGLIMTLFVPARVSDPLVCGCADEWHEYNDSTVRPFDPLEASLVLLPTPLIISCFIADSGPVLRWLVDG